LPVAKGWIEIRGEELQEGVEFREGVTSWVDPVWLLPHFFDP